MQNGHLRPEISIESEKIPLDNDQTAIEAIHLETVHGKILETQMSEEDERIVLNVGGVRHETHAGTLQNIPDSRLSNLAEQHMFSDCPKEVYFFDRHPAVFNSIIDFYRTGELHVPLEVCGAVVKRELDYWKINENHIKSCCWRTYRSYIENKRILDSFNRSILKEHVQVKTDHLEGWKKFQTKVWLILEHPRTSKAAMVYGIISLLFVVASISGFCLETLPNLKPKLLRVNFSTDGNQSSAGCDGEASNGKFLITPNLQLQIVDMICTAFFTIELIVRFVFSLNKLRFVRSAMNIIDLLALVPLYMQLILNMESFQFCLVNERLMVEIMFILRIIRMFRIFHLVKHYQALQILVYALKASVQELLMLGIFLLIGMLVFATMIYYAERKDFSPGEKFETIPMGFWWALITMTTVGYGDVYPTTPVGYVVGTACAVSGVLLVALTFPVISNNFTLFYTHVRSRRGRVDPNSPTPAGSEQALFHSDDDDNKLLYQNARRTSNGSIILNNRSFIVSRNLSGVTELCGTVSVNGRLSCGIPKDANSMADVLVKRDESSLFTRTSSVKAHSDDGVTYAGEQML